MDFLFTTLQRFRLLSLTVAWVAGVASILLAEPSGPVAVAGAYAFGLFILLTVARLRWDSLVILSVLGGVTWFLVGTVPTPEDILAGGERVLIFAALIPTMALVRATAMTMPSVHATQLRSVHRRHGHRRRTNQRHGRDQCGKDEDTLTTCQDIFRRWHGTDKKPGDTAQNRQDDKRVPAKTRHCQQNEQTECVCPGNRYWPGRLG